MLFCMLYCIDFFFVRNYFRTCVVCSKNMLSIAFNRHSGHQKIKRQNALNACIPTQHSNRLD